MTCRCHRRSWLLGLALAGVTLLILPARSHALGAAGQRLVARRAVAALPASLGDYLSGRMDGVIERAVEPSLVWPRQRGHSHRTDWGCCRLDAAASAGAFDAARIAAASFPQDEAEAKRMFRQAGLPHGGQLPWRLNELVDELADAFRSGDERHIVASSGYIIHFAAQAADPFRLTRDSAGAGFGCPAFGQAELGEPMFAHCTVEQRIGWELVRRNAERYGAALERADVRAEAASDPVAAIFARMLAAHAATPLLMEADAELTRRLALADGKQFLSRADEYYTLLDQRVEGVVQDILARGGELSAVLIVTAWERAGSPVLASGGAPTAEVLGLSGPDAHTKTDDVAPGDGQLLYCASKSSKIYHLVSCPHALRISEGNMVRFRSREEAESSGRRPCRMCKPDAG